MNGIEKFITIFVLTSTTCALYQKCESNPRNAFCGKYVTPFEAARSFIRLNLFQAVSIPITPELVYFQYIKASSDCNQ